MKPVTLVTSTLLLGLCAGCGSGITRYSPQLRARGEITLHYDNSFSMHAEGREIASSTTWGGLEEYVKCVPKARNHADTAESTGRAAVALSWTGAGIGLASLGSLGGLALYEQNKELAGGILAVGVAAAITGVVLAAVGRNLKNSANGNAIDAMNYYNDEVGSYGGSCKSPAAPLPEVPPQKPEKADPTRPQLTLPPDPPEAPEAPEAPKRPPITLPPAQKPPQNPDQI